MPDLEGADIFAAFQRRGRIDEEGEVQLEGVNLQNANLQLTNLSKTNLSRSNLQSSDLRFANLSSSRLKAASLRSARLNRAVEEYCRLGVGRIGTGENENLMRAEMEGADVRTIFESNERKAGFPHFTDLSKTGSLSQEQLGSMIGDRGVILPEGLEYREHWLEPDATTETVTTIYGSAGYGTGPYGGQTAGTSGEGSCITRFRK